MSEKGKQKKQGKKFSRTGLILVGCSLVCVILALAVGLPNGFLGDGGKGGDLDDENTPGLEEIMDGESPLLVFDKSESAKSLMQAFDEGRVSAVKILWEDGNGAQELISEDSDVIKEAYKGLKNIVVVDATEKKAGGAENHVTFVLDDDQEITYSFEGDNVLCYNDGSSETRYKIDGTGQLKEVYSGLKEAGDGSSK